MLAKNRSDTEVKQSVKSDKNMFFKNAMIDGLEYKTNFLWADSTLRKHYNTTEDETDKVGVQADIKIEPRGDV